MKKADIGLIGLAVMGENLALNMESKGFTVALTRAGLAMLWRGGIIKVTPRKTISGTHSDPSCSSLRGRGRASSSAGARTISSKKRRIA